MMYLLTFVLVISVLCGISMIGTKHSEWLAAIAIFSAVLLNFKWIKREGRKKL